MAGSVTPFVVKRPGNEQGRIEPANFEAPEGDWVLALGADSPGYEAWLAPDDLFDVYQEDAVSVGDDKILRFRSRVRGPSRVPALTGDEPFVLADGQTLQVSVDEGAAQTVTFNTADFVSIALATAIEVRDVLNAQLVGATAKLTGDDQVVLFSDDSGRHKGIRIVGGTAVAGLGITDLAWFAKLLLDGTVVARRELRPGETRDIDDMAGNLISYGTPVEVRFRLQLERK